MNKILKAEQLSSLAVGGVRSLIDNGGSAPDTSVKILGTAPVSKSADFGSTCKFGSANVAGGASGKQSKLGAGGGENGNSDFGNGGQ